MNESNDRPCIAASLSTLSCRVALVVTTLCVAISIADGALDHSQVVLVIAIVATAPYVANELVARKLACHQWASLVLCFLTTAICLGRLFMTVSYTLVMLFDRPQSVCSMIGLVVLFELWIVCAQCVVITGFSAYWIWARMCRPRSQQLDQ